MLAALVCRGHVLFEDVPGTAKTVLARAIAASIEGAIASRIQCTPDLQPTDVTGLSVFNQQTREFEFRPGPVFANILLVDEINRAMPKTQSALLEAMAERQVTVDGDTRALPDPFLVLATENPIEQEGTFPLPEAQLDRFVLKTELGYPTRRRGDGDRRRAARRPPARRARGRSSTLDEVRELAGARSRTSTSTSCSLRWIVELVRATRDARPRSRSARRSARASRSSRLARAWALLHGRDYVTPRTSRAVPAGGRPPARLHAGCSSRRRGAAAAKARSRRSASASSRSVPRPEPSDAARAARPRRRYSLTVAAVDAGRDPALSAPPARRLGSGGATSIRRGGRSDVASSRPYRPGDHVQRDRLEGIRAALVGAQRRRVHRPRALHRGDARASCSSSTAGPAMALYPADLPWLHKPAASARRSRSCSSASAMHQRAPSATSTSRRTAARPSAAPRSGARRARRATSGSPRSSRARRVPRATRSTRRTTT